uniref:Uncharacterized protein n=1 Tax=mine drainage metagenome TaxID=410659 RepID=E6PYM8_9ZZZZ
MTGGLSARAEAVFAAEAGGLTGLFSGLALGADLGVAFGMGFGLDSLSGTDGILAGILA